VKKRKERKKKAKLTPKDRRWNARRQGLICKDPLDSALAPVDRRLWSFDLGASIVSTTTVF